MKLLLFLMIAVLAMAQEERDLTGASCYVDVIMTDDDPPTDLKFSVSGNTCLKVNNNGLLKIYDVHRRLSGSTPNCGGKQLYNSHCKCNDRRRLSGGGDDCEDDYAVIVQGDGNVQVKGADGTKLWHINKTCFNVHRMLKGGSCADNEKYALVRNGCENDRIQVWEWKKQGNQIKFVKKIWSEEENTETCLA